MSVFHKAISDIFLVADFVESCVIDGQRIPCICSALPAGFVYTEAGLEQDLQTFTLDFQMPVPARLKIGKIVNFRGEKYKIKQIDIDSAGASAKAYLVSTSQGV